MSNVVDNYTNFALNRLIANYFIEDGAVGNADTKDYDEQATYEGGTGNRLSFYKYNERIKNYHTALKVLTGEQRANIYEAIPVIDYLNPENTSLLYTYPLNDSGKVDSTTIYPASQNGATALELLETEDEFTINRALLGEPIAEHFYNSIGNATDYNIQVSPWLGDTSVEYFYKGITNPGVYVNGVLAAPSQRKVDIHAIQVPSLTTEAAETLSSYSSASLSSMWIDFGMDETLSDEEWTKGSDDVYYDSFGIPIISPALDPEDPRGVSYINTFILDGINFVTETTKRYNEPRYLIEMNASDVCLAIPRSTYSDDNGFSKLLIFKKTTEQASASASAITWEGLLALTNVGVEEQYYLTSLGENAPENFSENIIVKCKKDISAAIDPSKVLDYWDIVLPEYVPYVVFASSYTSSYTLNTIEADSVLPSYLLNPYIYSAIKNYIAVERIYTAEASGLLSGYFCEPMERDHEAVTSDQLPEKQQVVTKWKFVDETELAEEHGVSIDIGAKYYSGHLLNRGDFGAEPFRLTASDPRYRKKVNGKVEEYYTQEQYDALSEDEKKLCSAYNGKASIVYDKLTSSLDTLFNHYKVENWRTGFNLHSLNDIVTKADYATGVTFTASEARDLLGQRTTSATTAPSRLLYPNKFKTNNNTVISQEEILAYFTSCIQHIDKNDPTILNLDLTNNNGTVCYTARRNQYKLDTRIDYDTGCGGKVKNMRTTTVEVPPNTPSVEGGTSSNELYTELNKTFHLDYSRDYNPLTTERANQGYTYGTPKGDIYGASVKVFSPLEAFSTATSTEVSTRYYTVRKNLLDVPFWDIFTLGTVSKILPISGKINANLTVKSESIRRPKGTLLLYPEYSKYYSNNPILLSTDDLGLEEYDDEVPGRRAMISFLRKDDGKVICYKVKSKLAFLPSQIRTVNLTISENAQHPEEKENFTLSYPYGLYPTLEPKTVRYIKDFATVRSSSTTTITYNGETFSVADLKNGKYKKYQTSEEVSTLWRVLYEDSSSTPGIGLHVAGADTLKGSTRQTKISEETTVKGRTSGGGTGGSYSSFEDRVNKENATVSNNQAVISATVTTGNASATFEVTIPRTSTTSTLARETLTTTTVNRREDRDRDRTPTYDFSDVSIDISGVASNMEVLYNKQRGLCVEASSGAYYNVPIFDTRSDYISKADTAYDCYIYILEPMQISLSSLTLYDQDDHRIEKINDLKNVDIVPMSYPSNYFAVSKQLQKNGITDYVLKQRSDLNSLVGSYILPGIPKFSTEEELRDSGRWNGLDLSSLANLIFNGDSATSNAVTSILGNSLSYIIKNFRLSNIIKNENYSESANPLLLEDLPSLIDGLIELKPILNKLYEASLKSAFTISVKGTEITIRPEYLTGLLSRLSSQDEYVPLSYTTSLDTSDWGEDYDHFARELWTRVKSFSVEVSDTEKTLKRPSLLTLRAVVNSAIGPEGEISAQSCEQLDNYFGNGTLPFLTTGHGIEFNDQILNLDSRISAASQDIGEKISNIILDWALDAKSHYLLENPPTQEAGGISEPLDLKEELKKIYLKYYTAASVDAIITSLNYSKFNKSEDLEIDPSLSDLRSVAEKVKSTFDSRRPLWSSSWLFQTLNNWLQKLAGTSEEDIYIASRLRAEVQKRTAAEAATLLSSYNFPTLDQVTEYLLSPNVELSTKPNYKGKFTGEELRNLEISTLTPGDIYTCVSTSYSPEEEGVNFYSRTNYVVAIDDGEFVWEEYNSVHNFFYKLVDLTSSSVNIKLTLSVPNYDAETNSFTPSYNIEDLSGDYYKIWHFNFANGVLPDISTPVLEGIAEFAKTSLEGTGDSTYYVKYVAGDEGPSGRENSLYFKRYQMLNNRMNTIGGTLTQIMTIFRNKDVVAANTQYEEDLIASYNPFIDVMPIARMEPLTYMPAQAASATEIQLPDKFYYSSELEALRSLISTQCVLTCTKCPVANGCPFYNQEELIKLYCTPAETIDFYVKDNRLDLIAYDQKNGADFVDVYTSAPDDPENKEYIDPAILQSIHLRYTDILRKLDGNQQAINYLGQDLEKVREKLNKSSYAHKFNNLTDGASLGYLLGGRYGTVEKNLLAQMANEDENFQEFDGVNLPTYKYLYDAIYVADEETEVNYTESSERYPVTFETGPANNKKIYKGTTRIQLPSSLKILSRAKPEDDVYLVSDDTTDDNGTKIVPVIYLGQVANLQWSFGIDLTSFNENENPLSQGVQSEDDTRIFASDIAQWCINYYKGMCDEDPIGDIGDSSAPRKDVNTDRDQYWMEKIKKKVLQKTDNGYEAQWITVEGRPREYTGYQEPLADPDNFDEVSAATGKPVVASYINFLRKFSIRIYDSTVTSFDDTGNYISTASWTIPWIKGASSKILSDKTVITIETQKAALAYMKTNLRLVVVKNLNN